MAYCSEDIRDAINTVYRMLEIETQELTENLSHLSRRSANITDDVCKHRVQCKKNLREQLERENNRISEMRLHIQDLRWDIEDKQEPTQYEEMSI